MNTNIANVQRASNITFFKTLDTIAKRAIWTKICSVVPSSGASETYDFMGELPGVNEWLDQRQVAALKKHTYTITNKHWESTIGLNRDNVNDNPGIIMKKVQMMARSFARHMNYLAITALVDGTTNTGYDSTAFFSNSHTGEDGNTYDNLLAGSGTTVANLKTDFQAAITAFGGFLARDGIPLFDDEILSHITIIHPIALTSNMKEAFLTDKVSTGGTNPYYGLAEPMASGILSDADDWYAFLDLAPLKPIIMQQRQAVKYETDFEDQFMNNTYHAGGDGRYNIGYGMWQTCVKFVN